MLDPLWSPCSETPPPATPRPWRWSVGVLSVVGTAGALLAARFLDAAARVDPGDLVYVACQILPYGLVGAVLLARTP